MTAVSREQVHAPMRSRGKPLRKNAMVRIVMSERFARRGAMQAACLLLAAATTRMDAATASSGAPIDTGAAGTGAARLAFSVARDERLMAKGVLPIFPLLTEQRDIKQLLADESAFRTIVLSADSEVDRRCTAASCKARAEKPPTFSLPQRLAEWTATGGTPRSEPAPPLTLGSLSLQYFETLAAASSNATAVMEAARAYTVAARDANELALFAVKSTRGSNKEDSLRQQLKTAEYLEGTVAAMERCASSLAQIVSLLPPQPSREEVERLYAEEGTSVL